MTANEESDSDDDFEEVASKDGYEADIPEHLKSKDDVAMGTSSANKPATAQVGVLSGQAWEWDEEK